MHFDFPIPFNSELRSEDLIPYKTNKKLEDSTYSLFTHPSFKYNKLAYNILNKYPSTINQLAVLAVAILRHYYLYPTQYGNKIENIELQIIVRLFKKLVQKSKISENQIKYLPTKQSILKHSEQFFDILQETCEASNYYQTADDMVKKRPGIGLRERKRGYSEEQILYYEQLDSG